MSTSGRVLPWMHTLTREGVGVAAALASPLIFNICGNVLLVLSERGELQRTVDSFMSSSMSRASCRGHSCTHSSNHTCLWTHTISPPLGINSCFVSLALVEALWMKWPCYLMVNTVHVLGRIKTFYSKWTCPDERAQMHNKICPRY